jgi:hypothetical protein
MPLKFSSIMDTAISANNLNTGDWCAGYTSVPG